MNSTDTNDGSGEWTPPTGPTHPDPISASDPAAVPSSTSGSGRAPGTAQSLLPISEGDQVTVSPDDAQAPPNPKGSRMVVGALVLLALFLLVGVLVLTDWAVRNLETVRLLHQIERSESAMGETQAATVAVAGTAPQGTFPLGDDDLPPDVAAAMEDVSATGRDAVAEAGQEVAVVSFLPWHTDLIAAQRSYLEHNLAWVNHLEAGSKQGEVLVRGDDDDIGSTWKAAEASLRAALPVVPFPGIPERLDTIFEDESDDSSGPTLEVAGPRRLVNPVLA